MGMWKSNEKQKKMKKKEKKTMQMSDKKLNEIVEQEQIMLQSEKLNTRYVIEYQPLDSEKPMLFWTANLEHAKKRAEIYTLDPKYKNITIHEVSIEKSWSTTPSVSFQERKD